MRSMNLNRCDKHLTCAAAVTGTRQRHRRQFSPYTAQSLYEDFSLCKQGSTLSHDRDLVDLKSKLWNFGRDDEPQQSLRLLFKTYE